MNPLTTPERAVRRLTDVRGRVAPTELHRLSGTNEPGIYAWFIDAEEAGHLTHGLSLPVSAGLIYAGQAGAGRSHATLGSRVRGNHLGSDIYGSAFPQEARRASAGSLGPDGHPRSGSGLPGRQRRGEYPRRPRDGRLVERLARQPLAERPGALEPDASEHVGRRDQRPVAVNEAECGPPSVP